MTIFNEPMDQAVDVWRVIHDKEFRERMQNLVALSEEWNMRDARKLLTLCETLDPGDIYEIVNKSPPSAYVIASLVILAKQSQKTKAAKASAKKRHTGNHASKLLVFQWCDANIDRFSSMDDAALDIAESFVPQKFRAVRDWITEWKKLRSASTP